MPTRAPILSPLASSLVDFRHCLSNVFHSSNKNTRMTPCTETRVEIKLRQADV